MSRAIRGKFLNDGLNPLGVDLGHDVLELLVYGLGLEITPDARSRRP